MSTSITSGSTFTTQLKPSSFADKALKGSVWFWYAVAVLGQWAFVFYIVAVYGHSTFTGNFQAWNKNPIFRMGYVAGDTLGNVAFGMHALLAAVITFGGGIQLIPQIRARAISVHRWIGRAVVVSLLGLSFSGLYMKTLRGARGSKIEAASTILNALLIIAFALLAWRAARSHEIPTHRRWALRTYLVANAQWFRQVGVLAWIIVNHGPVGITDDFEGPFMYFWDFGSYLLPLLVLELYLRTQESPGPRRRLAMSGALIVLTLLMALGAIGTARAFYIPIAKTVNDPRTSIADTMSATIDSSGIDEAAKQYYSLKATQPTVYNFDEPELEKLGYKFIKAKKFKEALRLFQLNVEAYPKSSNAYDSLGEAYMGTSDKATAILNYQKSIQLDPRNTHPGKMLKKINTP
jgi:hypothetical protein